MALVFLAQPAASQAQDAIDTDGAALQLRSPVLIIDYDRVFSQSRFGQRVLRDIEAEGRALIAENERIEAELSAEERTLTDQRNTLTSAEFRDLADAFDSKVQQFRQTQQRKAQSVGSGRDTEERRFRQLLSPIIAQIMQDAGALVVLDRRDAVVWVEAINITEAVLRAADQMVGDGRRTPVAVQETPDLSDTPMVDQPAAAPDSPLVMPTPSAPNVATDLNQN